MITFCKYCIMPNSRPRVVFNDKGICNACENGFVKQKINWNKKKDEFLKLIDEKEFGKVLWMRGRYGKSVDKK